MGRVAKLSSHIGERPATVARYRVLAKWASGGMADVYLARQRGAGGFDKLVALKFLRAVGDEADSFYQMFLDEARTAALLNHPCIVQTFDVGAIDERPYMTMEFVHGETLGRFARSVRRARGRFPVDLAAHLTRELASALQYAHTLRNIDGEPLHLVHRDVSPSNALVSFEGAVKLLDFGIARVATQTHTTRAGVLKGKFSYMSPEQVSGEPVDHRSDIFSLGLVMWQLLTGEQAFQADSDPALLHLVSRAEIAPPSDAGVVCSSELDSIVMRALTVKAADRYQTAGAFAEALARYLAHVAPGYDGGKEIRLLMAEHFAERRERLAAAVKNSDGFDFGSQEMDALTPALRTPPSGYGMFLADHGRAPEPEVEEIVYTTAAPATMASMEGPRRGRLLAVGVVLVAAVGLFLLRDQLIGADGDDPVAMNDARVAADTVTVLAEPQPVVVVSRPEPPALEVDASPAPPAAVAPAPVGRTLRPPPTRRRPEIEPKRKISRAEPAIDAGAAPPPRSHEPRAPAPAPAPGRTAPPPATTPVAPPRETGSLDATPSLVRVAVQGPLPTSELENAIGRVTDDFRACYRSAARKAGRTPALTIKISFVIDEGRAARSARVGGDSLGVAGCMRSAISKIRTRVAPDVGTASASALVKFTPTR
jgi:hypothetical protein